MIWLVLSVAPLVTMPDKWHLDRERSATMMTADQGVKHFGNAPSTDVIEAYYPVEVGAGLVVSRYTTTALPDGRDAAIAAIVADFEGAQKFGAVTERTTDRTTGPNQLEVTLGWTEKDSAMRYMHRMVIAANATSVVAVTGACLERDDANIVHVGQCRQALLTLDPGIPVEERTAIAFPGAEPAMITPDTPGMKLGGGATLGDGAKFKFPPIQVPQDAPTADKRPYFIGLGVLVLAGAIWWNRRSREKFERDERDSGEPKPRRRRERDDDADDLRDAARGPDAPDSTDSKENRS